MYLIRTVLERLATWRRYKSIVNELSNYTDDELSDIGVYRVVIWRIARESASR